MHDTLIVDISQRRQQLPDNHACHLFGEMSKHYNSFKKSASVQQSKCLWCFLLGYNDSHFAMDEVLIDAHDIGVVE